MLNLALLNYDIALSKTSSPIVSLAHSEVLIGERSIHQVNAILSPELKGSHGPQRVLFGDVDGTGTQRSKLVATHMAISEALERWAWGQAMESEDQAAHGFDRDPTTNGMAAFPGLIARQTRPHAVREAVERWCLREWWAGHLPCAQLETSTRSQQLIRIGNPLSRHKVVISWAAGESGLVAYGVGCGQKTDAASWRARIEQQRAQQALEHFAEKHEQLDTIDLSYIPGYAERSFLYYALSKGHSDFLQCVGNSAVNPEILDSATGRRYMKPVVDCPIPGPWTKYAHVWRVLYPPRETEGESDYTFYA